MTDAEVMKEAKPSIYLKKILPILLKNSVVHIIGFGNRLAFDPIPFELQVTLIHIMWLIYVELHQLLKSHFHSTITSEEYMFFTYTLVRLT